MFWQLILNILCKDVVSQLWVCQAVGVNHHQCSSIFTLQANITGVTAKDKERHPSTLAKQNGQGLGLYGGSSHLKTKKIKAFLQRHMRKENLMWFIEVNIRWSIIYFIFICSQNSSSIAVKPWFWIKRLYKWL